MRSAIDGHIPVSNIGSEGGERGRGGILRRKRFDLGSGDSHDPEPGKGFGQKGAEPDEAQGDAS